MNKETAKILLVEDDATIRFVVELQLKALGYALSATAENGKAALDKVLADHFDIILMDVRMPDMDGLTATRLIREQGKKSVIIGMTAFSVKQECLQAGMDDFIQKPIVLQQLDEILSRWLTVSHRSNGKSKVMRIPPPEKFQQTREALNELERRVRDLRRKTGLVES